MFVTWHIWRLNVVFPCYVDFASLRICDPEILNRFILWTCSTVNLASILESLSFYPNQPMTLSFIEFNLDQITHHRVYGIDFSLWTLRDVGHLFWSFMGCIIQKLELSGTSKISRTHWNETDYWYRNETSEFYIRWSVAPLNDTQLCWNISYKKACINARWCYHHQLGSTSVLYESKKSSLHEKQHTEAALFIIPYSRWPYF